MRFATRIFLTALLLCTAGSAQSRSPYDSSTQENVYTNFFFQFRYPFTASWVPQPASVAEELQKAGEAGSLGSDTEQTYYLLTLFRTIPGQGPAGKVRAMISLVAMDNSANPEITSGKEAVLALAEKMKARHYTAVGEPQEIQISGQSFFRQDMKGPNTAGTPVYESVVFTVTRGYSFGFVLVSPSQTLLTSMIASLGKAKFY